RVKTTMATQGWVEANAMSILQNDPTIGCKELQEKLKETYDITIGYDTVWAGKSRAKKQIYGTLKQSFQNLHNFKAEVEKRSPGSIVEVDTKVVDGKVHFHRFFMALKPSIDGFLAGCRPYLSIDSMAFNGRWRGYLAACTTLDGHNWMFPVAIGFIDGETEENWTWFMSQLNRALGSVPNLAICIDACKGLENAVKKVFPHVEQRECFRHLMANFT
uniref:MULE transposase domain-containing protein n=1 Tax=Aegilops tauschii subsp. strangulata TaxID=200361 RepID=A0A453M9L0_AEGTS